MRTTLATKLAIANGQTLVSRAVDMAGANAVEVEVVIESNAAGDTVTVFVEVGNNLATWQTFAQTDLVAVPYGSLKVTAIPSRYVRVSYNVNGGEIGDRLILSSTIDTQKL